MPITTPQLLEAPTGVLEALPRLSYRDRRHAVDTHDADPGHHLLVEGGGESALIPLTNDITHIGRGFTANVRLDDPSVSRAHAIIAIRGNRVLILDDCSANGTYVNGRRVTEARLSDGDVVVLGHVVMTFLHIR